MKKEQRRVTLLGGELTQRNNELDQMLSAGWHVVQMCPFSEPVALGYGGQDIVLTSLKAPPTKLHGNYGVVFILEKETNDK